MLLSHGWIDHLIMWILILFLNIIIKIVLLLDKTFKIIHILTFNKILNLYKMQFQFILHQIEKIEFNIYYFSKQKMITFLFNENPLSLLLHYHFFVFFIFHYSLIISLPTALIEFLQMDFTLETIRLKVIN